ncbi:MAG: hypothetical protein GF331_20400 [Chitinivibrionales bacterium]|nr:hypothetical protein [Chitinivibrionales bacterium]
MIDVNDDFGANLDSVLAIRYDYAPFVHYTQRATLALSVPLVDNDRMQQAIGLRAEYYVFRLLPDQVTLDFAYLLRFPSSGWSIGLVTDRLLQGAFSSTYFPHESYLWRSATLACGRQHTLVRGQARTVLALDVAASATLRFRRATSHRDAVLEGGLLISERELLAGLCAEAPVLEVFTPRIGIDMGVSAKHFRLTGGARLSLVSGFLSVDVGIYEEKGGATDDLVYQIGVLVGKSAQPPYSPSSMSTDDD